MFNLLYLAGVFQCQSPLVQRKPLIGTYHKNPQETLSVDTLFGETNRNMYIYIYMYVYVLWILCSSHRLLTWAKDRIISWTAATWPSSHLTHSLRSAFGDVPAGQGVQCEAPRAATEPGAVSGQAFGLESGNGPVIGWRWLPIASSDFPTSCTF